MDIVYYIKKEAQRQKTTISEIAEKLGMSQASLSQMLKPDSIKFSVVKRIADILNVSISTLTGEIPPSGQSVQEEPPSTESRLLSIIESQQRTIETLTQKPN